MNLAYLLLLAAVVPGQRGRPQQGPPSAQKPPVPITQQVTPAVPAKQKPPAPPANKMTSGAPGLPEPGQHEFVDAANDRAGLPADQQGYYFYFTTATAAPEDQTALVHELNFVVASMCYKPDLEAYLPQKVSDTLYRINTYSLGWHTVWHQEIVENYPYYWQYDVNIGKYSPLVIRADWFVADAFDQSRTGDMYLQFLYAGNPPKNLDDFYKFWGIAEKDRQFVFGLAEGSSGVAVGNNGQPGRRLIENFPSSRRGYAWSTRDAKKNSGKFDPISTLPDKMAFDGQEHIYGMFKTRAGKSGNINAYLLTDSQRKVVVKGPTDLVVAKSPADVRGVEICNGATCVHCHTNGIITFSKNEYRSFIMQPTRLFQDYKTREETQRFYGADISKMIEQDQQSYSDGVAIVNGLTAGQNARHYHLCVKNYIAPLTIEQVARELAVLYGDRLTAAELRLALGNASSRLYLSNRSASLAEGDKIFRDDLVEDYYLFQEVIDQWTSVKPKK